LSAFIARICIDNKITGSTGHYVEPYAGGASVALFLLFEGYVNKITINDKDRSIYAFWHSVLNETDRLCRLISETEITIENWMLQKEIQRKKKTVSLLELGFSTLFLNRVNRSGIINGGIIGGILQTGEYKIDCRFNKDEIINRIQKIAAKKSNIRLYKKDAIKLIDKIQKECDSSNTVFYFDPPYYLKGSLLYMNHYKTDDHLAVSQKIKKIKKIKWIVSYDNHAEIKELYNDCSKKEYSFNHSAHTSKIGDEILFFSKNLQQPMIKNWNPLNFKYRKRNKIDKLVYKAN
jgi:DNA adenine methylase